MVVNHDEILGKQIVVYPTIEEAVGAYTALADRRDFLEKNPTCP